MDNPDQRVYCDGEETPDPLGYWVIGGSELLRLLRLASEGGSPEMIYAEAYANAEVETTGE